MRRLLGGLERVRVHTRTGHADTSRARDVCFPFFLQSLDPC